MEVEVEQMVRSASTSASTVASAAGGSAAFGRAARTHSLTGCSPANVWMRAYSSGVTFVPIDFVRRDAMRRLLTARHAKPVAHRRNLVNQCSCRGTTAHDHRECRTFRVVPIREPAFLCSTRN